MRIEDKINFRQTLQSLVSDRCENCKNGIKVVGRKWCQRCIDRYKRKQSFSVAKLIAAIERDYLTAEINDFPEQKEELSAWNPAKDTNLFLFGDTGTGKTRAIFALLKDCLIKGCTAKRHEFTALCSMIRDTFSNNSRETENSIVERLSGLDVLFIDDLGISNKATDFDYEVLYRIIDKRLMACLPTVIASNKSLEQIGQIYDKRIESRLQKYQKILFAGQDKRKMRNNA